MPINFNDISIDDIKNMNVGEVVQNVASEFADTPDDSVAIQNTETGNTVSTLAPPVATPEQEVSAPEPTPLAPENNNPPSDGPPKYDASAPVVADTMPKYDASPGADNSAYDAAMKEVGTPAPADAMAPADVANTATTDVPVDVAVKTPEQIRNEKAAEQEKVYQDIAETFGMDSSDPYVHNTLKQNVQVAKDILIGAAQGPGDFIKKSADILRSWGVPDYTLQITNEDGEFDPIFMAPEETARKKAEGMRSILTPVELESPAGQAAQALSSMVFGYMTLGKFTNALGVSSALTKAGMMTVGEGVMNAIIMDKDDVRMSTMLRQLPGGEKFTMDWLANKDEDESYGDAKLKAFVEGVLVGLPMSVVAPLTQASVKSLKAAKAAKIARETNPIVKHAGAEEVVDQMAINNAIKENAEEMVMRPTTPEDINNRFISSITGTEDVATKVVPEPGMGDDVMQAVVKKPAGTVADVVENERTTVNNILKDKGYNDGDIMTMGDLSDQAGFVDSTGQPITKSTASIGKEKKLNFSHDDLVVTREDGAAFLDFSKINNNEDLMRVLGRTGKAATAEGAGKSLTNDVLQAHASKIDMEKLSAMINRPIDVPLTAHEVVVANTVLHASKNSIVAQSRNLLRKGGVGATYDFEKALATHADLESVIALGRKADGDALRAWSVPVSKAAVPQSGKLPLQVVDAQGNVIAGAKFVSEKTGKEVNFFKGALNTDGSIRKGVKAVDAEGNAVANAASGLLNPEDVSRMAKVERISHKRNIAMTKKITKIANDKGRDAIQKAMIIDDLARRETNDLARQLSQIAAESAKPSKWEMASNKLYSIWVNGLLSGPQTHIANIVSNATTTFMGVASEFNTQLFRAMRQDGGSLAEATAHASGLWSGFGEGLSLAAKKTKNVALEAGTKMETAAQSAWSTPAPKQFGARMAWAANRGIELPGEALQRSDLFFKGVNYRTAINREAAHIAQGQGLKGKEYTEFYNHLRSNPTEDMMTRSAEYAEMQTFTKTLDPESTVGRLQKVMHATLPGKVIAPFIRTPANIIGYTFKHIPGANMLLSSERAAWKAGGRAWDEVAGRLMLGTEIMGAGALLTYGGMLTGSGPSDYKQRKALEATGWQPNSLKFGDTYVSLQRIEPLGSLLALSADTAHLLSYMTTEEQNELTGISLTGILRMQKDKTFMSGPVDLLATMFSNNTSDKALGKYFVKMASTVMPYSSAISGVKNYLDPEVRDVSYDETQPFALAKMYLDKMKERYGFSEGMPLKRDVWGQPYEYNETLAAPGFISPISVSHDKHDKVNNIIAKSGVVISETPKQIAGTPLNNEEHSEYVRIAGELAKKRMDAIVATGAFDANQFNGPGSRFDDILHSVLRSSRKIAAQKVRAQFPALNQRMVETKTLEMQLKASSMRPKQ